MCSRTDHGSQEDCRYEVKVVARRRATNECKQKKMNVYTTVINMRGV